MTPAKKHLTPLPAITDALRTMTAAAPTFEADTPSLHDRERALLERQLEMLDRVARAAVNISTAVETEVKAAAEAEDGSHADRLARLDVASRAQERAAHGLRMTLLLQTRVFDALKALERGKAIALVPLAMERKARVTRIVGRIASEEHPNNVLKLHQLRAETAERLQDDALYGDIMTKPISELIAMICKDLGLDPDWLTLSEQDWAQKEIESGKAGWPLAASSSPPRVAPLRGPPRGGEELKGPVEPPRNSAAHPRTEWPVDLMME